MKSFYDFIANLFYSIVIYRNQLYSFFIIKEVIDYREIPIVINNRNRFTFFKSLVEYLIERNYKNIYVLDNNSTYPPLLDYYSELIEKGVNIIYLNKNLGFKALEKINLYKQLKKNYFVYTDPDVLPINSCPDDFLFYFLKLMKKYPRVQKVGFGLKIDDLPDCFNLKEDVINWENKINGKELEKDVFESQIDTTFALHRPLSCISTQGRFIHIRTKYPYEARHLPWYNDSSNLSEEELYYINSVEIGTHWSTGAGYKNKSFFVRLIKKFFN